MKRNVITLWMSIGFATGGCQNAESDYVSCASTNCGQSDADTDTDADADTDTDADTDADTDTDPPAENSLVDFEGGCPMMKTALPPPMAEFDPALYPGLECVSWAAQDDGTLEIGINQWNENCYDFYGPVAVVDEDNNVLLTIEHGSEYNCVCCYDFTFAVAGVDLSVDTHLSAFFGEINIPLSAEPTGTRCRVPGGYPHGCEFENPLHSFCSPSWIESGCPPDLVCHEDLHVCVEPCETDLDCSFEYLSCQEGACLITDPW